MTRHAGMDDVRGGSIVSGLAPAHIQRSSIEDIDLFIGQARSRLQRHWCLLEARSMGVDARNRECNRSRFG